MSKLDDNSDHRKDLQKRVDQISLPESTKMWDSFKEATKIAVDKIGEHAPGIAVINTLINLNEKVQEEFDRKKKEILLETYFKKNDENQKAIEDIQDFICNPYGNVLFNKLFKILSDRQIDPELNDILSNVLKGLNSGDLEAHFEDNKFALDQIELLSTQSLVLLSKAKQWPMFSLNFAYQQQGKIIVSEWVPYFGKSFCATYSINHEKVIDRIIHTFNELLARKLILAVNENKNGKVYLTQVGLLIYNLITTKD